MLRIRPMLVLLSIAGAAAAAAVVSYLVASDALRAADAKRLDQDAKQVLREAEAVVGEVDTVLDSTRRSQHEFCSEVELSFLRDLVFRARYIRDVGRLRDDRLICTSTDGVLPAPHSYARPPDLVIPQGDAIYIGYPLLIAPGEHSTIVVRGDANVVLSADAFEDLLPPPLQYSIWLRTNLRDRIVGVSGFGVRARPEQLKISGRLNSDDELISVACSRVSDFCAAAIARNSDILAQNSSQMLGFGALGGVAGAGLAAAVIFGLRRRQTLAAQLHRAIENDELSLVYEPLVDLGSTRTVGAEVLARWRDEQGQPVMPDIFIALAEEQGLIGGITEFVIRRATEELRDLLRRQEFRISINIAAVDLIGVELPGCLDRYVDGRGIPSDRVAFELTERSTADRTLIVRAIQMLRGRGHPVFLDDFGVGYSSLSYLHELGVDAIKIEKSFTAVLGGESVTASVVPQILSMATSLKLGVVVEGVETPVQEKSLRELGVQLVQGWLYGKPMSAKELIARIDSESSRTDALHDAAAKPAQARSVPASRIG
jgi:sensor c-di-GMP phosphodiesterase-like protein